MAVVFYLVYIYFVFSYESMKSLCSRYNEVVDDCRQLVIVVFTALV